MAHWWFLLICFAVDSSIASHRDRRLVLHSDLDIAQKVLNLELQVARMQTEIQQKESRISQLESAVQNVIGSGSSYVRWGRITCPGNGTSLVYAGFMGTAADRLQTGSGSNYLCLSDQPQWDHYEDNVESLGKIAGVEYQFWNHRANGASNFFGYDVYNDDVPCAVCHSPRSSSIMIPGRMECYPGWTKEYNGYLVSGYVGQAHDTEFICLDRRPEALNGGKTDDDEAMLYFVEGVCGKSLECPPRARINMCGMFKVTAMGMLFVSFGGCKMIPHTFSPCCYQLRPL